MWEKPFCVRFQRIWGSAMSQSAPIPGGIAVSGECSLIGMWETGGIYVCLYQPAGGGNDVLLYRTIRHSRDYKGGYNRYLTCRISRSGLTCICWIP